MCLDKGFSARIRTAADIGLEDSEKPNVTVRSFELEGSLRWMVFCLRSL